jgi:hypothetical protein
LVGLVVLVRHGLSRRTVKPAVYGVTALGATSFMLAATVPVILPSGPLNPSRGGGMVAAVALAVGAFALGHRAGQERDAREARKWLALDRRGCSLRRTGPWSAETRPELRHWAFP